MIGDMLTEKLENFDKTLLLEKMTDSQKRVVIAKSVIANLQNRRYMPSKWDGHEYVTCAIITSRVISDDLDPIEVDVKEILSTHMKQCTTRIRGALFLAAVETFGNLKKEVYNQEDVLSSIDIDKYLLEYFDNDDLNLIEFICESNYSSSLMVFAPYRFFVKKPEMQIAVNIYRRTYPDLKDLMVAIMSNIIKHNGEFVCDKSILTIKP